MTNINYKSNYKNLNLILLFIVFILSINVINSQIIINEVSSINYNILLDDDHSNEDWIELYNPTDSSINIKEFRISDKSDFQTAWVFPDTTIAPHSFIIIFASDKNRVIDDKYIIETNGQGIYYWVNPEGYTYIYKEHEGDFEAKVRIHNFENADYFANAGIMIRNKIDNESKFISFNSREYKVYPDIITSFREKNNQRIIDYDYSITRVFQYPDIYLYIKRIDSIFYTEFRDITDYLIKRDSIILILNEDVFIGIQANSRNMSKTAKVYFSDFKINNELQNFDEFKFVEFNVGEKGKFYKNSTLHSDFKLSDNGDNIYLWDNKGNIIDKVEIPILTKDYTYSRENTDTISIENTFGFSYPTPNKLNSEIYLGITESPIINTPDNFFSDIVQLKITSTDDSKIFYTTNNDNPTLISNEYISKIDSVNYIILNNSTVIKAIAIKENYLPSRVVTHSFIKNYNSNLNLLSISMNNDELYDNSKGLYSIYKNYEFIANVEFFESKKNILNQNVGIQLHGGLSREFNQKSFRLYARNELDKGGFENIKFNNNQIKNYAIDRLVIRNSGQDYFSLKMRDALAHQLIKNLENLDYLDYLPVNVFLNGNYNGFYNLRERFDDNYIRNKYKVKKEDINLLGLGTLTKNGNGLIFEQHFNEIINLSAQDSNFINYTNERIDIDNFLDYIFVNTFLAQHDWNGQNIFKWNIKNGKFKYQPYDLDYTSEMVEGYAKTNMFYIMDNYKEYEIYKIFFKLMENDSLKNKFIVRALDKINTTFSTEFILNVVDNMKNNIINDVKLQQELFPESILNWNTSIDSLIYFFKVRPELYKLHLTEFFRLKNNYKKIEILTKNQSITLNTIKFNNDFNGEYLFGQKINLSVNLSLNKILRHWVINDTIIIKANNIELLIENNMFIEPIIDTLIENNEVAKIVINEIMYKSPDEFDDKDWIELYNNTENDYTLDNWQLFDSKENEEFTFPINTTIKSYDYLIVTRSNDNFIKIHQNLDNKIGDFKFGLGEVDQVRLFDNNKTLIDSVSYTSSTPWYPETNGQGLTLELINPDFDNTLAENWQPSLVRNGTPGKRNSIISTISSGENKSESYIYPNPNIGIFKFKINNLYNLLDTKFRNHNYSKITVEVVDIMGIKYYESELNELIKDNSIIDLDINMYDSNLKIYKGSYYLKLLKNGKTFLINKFILTEN